MTFKKGIILAAVMLFCVAASKAFANGAIAEEVLGGILNRTLRSIPESTWAEIRGEASVIQKEALFRRHAAAAFARDLRRSIDDDVLKAVRHYLEKPERIGQLIERNPKIFETLGVEVREGLAELSRIEMQTLASQTVVNRLRGSADDAIERSLRHETNLLPQTQKAPKPIRLTEEAAIDFFRAVEQYMPEGEKFALLEVVFPEFRISESLFRENPKEWFLILMQDGKFALERSMQTEEIMLVQYYSKLAGGMDAALTAANDTLKIEITFIVKAEGRATYYQHQLLYEQEKLFRWRLLKDGDQVMWDHFVQNPAEKVLRNR